MHFGHNRNHLSNHVDDVLLDNALWSVQHHCTPRAGDCPDGVGNDPAGPTVRMQAADVTWVMEWQKANGLRLDLAFNAEGAAPGDPLTSAVLSNRGAFGWINHTWSHPFLGCAAY